MNDKMKVKDLLQLLEEVDPEVEVWLYFNNGISPASIDESIDGTSSESIEETGMFIIGVEPE